MHISSACAPRQEGHFRVDLSLRRRMRGLRRGKAPFAGIWLRQIPCLKRLLSRRRRGKAPPSVLRATRLCAASSKAHCKQGFLLASDTDFALIMQNPSFKARAQRTALVRIPRFSPFLQKSFASKSFLRVLRICNNIVRNDGKQGKRHNFGCAYIEPLALVRHGCGILLQAGIPCACRACAAPRRAERSEESPHTLS